MSANPSATAGRQKANSSPSAADMSTALADLRVAGNSIGNRDWLSAEIAGEPVVSLGTLGSTANPLSALASAGCDFLTPIISFLEEPLQQLRGEPNSVSEPAGQHDSAASSAASVADDYRSTVDGETSGWSGNSKQNYTDTASKLVDGVKSVAEAAATNSAALTAAGQVVAQVADIVTRLVTEAVGKIVPIMTEAIAAAPATFGASIAQAIPECVSIAVDYGGRIAAKLSALLASGENLMTLVQGAAAALDVANKGLTAIGQLAGAGSSANSSSGHTQGSSGGSSTKNNASSGSSTRKSGSSLGDGSSSSSDNASLGQTSLSSAQATTPHVPDTSTPTTATSPGDNAAARLGSVLGAPGFRSAGRQSERAGATAAARKSASGTAAGMMMAGPMAAGSGQRAGDKEHNSPDWLRRDNDLFDPVEPAVPAIIDKPLDGDAEGVGAPLVSAPAPARELTADDEGTEVQSVKMTWRLSETGELEAIPVSGESNSNE